MRGDDERQDESLNPNAVAVIRENGVMVAIDVIADACTEYEQWQDSQDEHDEE